MSDRKSFTGAADEPVAMQTLDKSGCGSKSSPNPSELGDAEKGDLQEVNVTQGGDVGKCPYES